MLATFAYNIVCEVGFVVHTKSCLIRFSVLTVETRIFKSLITLPAQVKGVQNTMALKPRLCI